MGKVLKAVWSDLFYICFRCIEKDQAVHDEKVSPRKASNTFLEHSWGCGGWHCEYLSVLCAVRSRRSTWGNWQNAVWEWGKDQSDVLDFLVWTCLDILLEGIIESFQNSMRDCWKRTNGNQKWPPLPWTSWYLIRAATSITQHWFQPQIETRAVLRGNLYAETICDWRVTTNIYIYIHYRRLYIFYVYLG